MRPPAGGPAPHHGPRFALGCGAFRALARFSWWLARTRVFDRPRPLTGSPARRTAPAGSPRRLPRHRCCGPAPASSRGKASNPGSPLFSALTLGRRSSPSRVRSRRIMPPLTAPVRRRPSPVYEKRGLLFGRSLARCTRSRWSRPDQPKRKA